MKQKTGNSRLLIEAMEPRLLFSADLDGGLLSGGLASHSALLNPALVDNHVPAAADASDTRAASAVRQELVLVDTDTPEYQQLIDDLLAQDDTSRHLEVVLLDNTRDGIHQVTEILSNYRGLDAVHLISHGSDGTVELGGSVLEFDSLKANTGLIQSWGGAFSDNGDLLIYGCNLAATTSGQGMVDALGRLTGADVAASDDLTGSATLGGDWELEYATGKIEARVAVGADLQATWSQVLAVAVDKTSTGQEATANTVSFQHDTAVGADRLMLVGVSISRPIGGTEAVSSITYNGNNLSFVGAIDQSNGKAGVEIWSLLAPDTGDNTVQVNLTGTNHLGFTVGVMTFTGVDQTTPLGAFASNEGSGDMSGSATVSSATGELVFGVLAIENPINDAITQGSGQTEHWELFQTQVNGAGSTEAGAASVTTAYSWSTNEKWAIGAVSIKSAGNDAPSDITLSNAAVDEHTDTSSGYSIGTLTATDPDGGDTHNYSIVGGPDQAKFSIGGAGLDELVLTDGTLDYETQGSYQVMVRATDNGAPNLSYDELLTITVNDLNDAPVINDQVFNIDENRAMNFVVGTPVVNDPDAGDTLTWSITGGTGATAFSILSTNGQIRVADPSQIDFETNPSFTLDVRVEDAGGLFDTATITININDLNERPTLNNASVTLDENSANGTPVVTMAATDPDAGDSQTYTITGGNIGNAFAIDPVTGEITVNDASMLDYEAIGNASNPAFAPQTGAANPLNGVGVAQRSAPALVDIDGDGDLDAVIGDYAGNLHFFENTGDAMNPNFVAVTGPANPFDGIDIGVRSTPAFADIDNDGDQDIFVGERYGGIAYFENVGSDTSPAFVQVTGAGNPLDGAGVPDMAAPTFIDIDNDGDLDCFSGEWFGTMNFFENTGTAANPVFTERTGAANPLNGVSAPNYMEWQPRPTFADLDADGDYDAFIGLKNGSTEYWENTGDAATPVFTQQTGDANPLRTAGSGGNGEAAPAFADIDGDGDLDLFYGNALGTINFYENKPVFNLTVRATDSGGLVDTAIVRIDLDDVNEGPTDIDLSNNLIDEHIDTTGGYSVGTLVTTDEDGGETHTYTIVGGADAGLFSIGGAGSNELLLNDGILDFESKNSYQVTLRVTDSGTPGLTHDKSFTITVNDLNDAPVLAGANDLITINEDPVGNTGTPVSALIAGQVSDADAVVLEGIAVTGVDNSNGSWEYSINGGGTWQAFGTPGTATARLLAADASTYVRFVPNANWNGTVTNGLTFHAWDRTGGSNGGTDDLSVNTGPAAPYSTATASSSIVVNAIPDAPVIGGDDTGSVTEDAGVVGGYLVDTGSLSIVDPDAGEDNFIAETIVGTYGSLTIDAAGNWNYSALNNQAAIEALLAGDSLVDTLTVTTGDGTTHDVVITINGANDAPVANDDGPVTVNAGTSVTIDLATNDTDIDNAIDLTSIIIVNGPAFGTLTIINDGTVIYTHDGSATSVSDSFTYAILDAAGAVSNTATVTLVIDPADIQATAAAPPPEAPPVDDEEPAPEPAPREAVAARAPVQTAPKTGQAMDETGPVAVTSATTEDSADYSVDNIVLVSQDNPGLGQRTLQGMIDKLERFNHELWEVLEGMRNQMSSNNDADDSRVNLFVKATTGLTLTLSVSAVTWAIRGTSVMASMLSSMPMWKGFDPLPLLSASTLMKSRNKDENNELSGDDRIADERVAKLLNNSGTTQASDRQRDDT